MITSVTKHKTSGHHQKSQWPNSGTSLQQRLVYFMNSLILLITLSTVKKFLSKINHVD